MTCPRLPPHPIHPTHPNHPPPSLLQIGKDASENLRRRLGLTSRPAHPTCDADYNHSVQDLLRGKVNCCEQGDCMENIFNERSPFETRYYRRHRHGWSNAGTSWHKQNQTLARFASENPTSCAAAMAAVFDVSVRRSEHLYAAMAAAQELGLELYDTETNVLLSKLCLGVKVTSISPRMTHDSHALRDHGMVSYAALHNGPSNKTSPQVVVCRAQHSTTRVPSLVWGCLESPTT